MPLEMLLYLLTFLLELLETKQPILLYSKIWWNKHAVFKNAEHFITEKWNVNQNFTSGPNFSLPTFYKKLIQKANVSSDDDALLRFSPKYCGLFICEFMLFRF